MFHLESEVKFLWFNKQHIFFQTLKETNFKKNK